MLGPMRQGVRRRDHVGLGQLGIDQAGCRQVIDDLQVADARISRDLGFFFLVAVDADCLVRAVDIGRDFGLRTLDAIHLAAARILPSECSFVTFDDRQREAAEDLGLKVLTPPV